MARLLLGGRSALRALGWATPLVAGTSACGSKKDSNYHPNTPGFGGDGGSGAGGVAGSGASGGSAGAAGGSGGTAGSGGTGGTGTAGCTGLAVKGTLDGKDVDTSIVSGALIDSGSIGSGWMYNLLVAHGGLLSLEGTAAATPKTGDPVNGTGFLAAPPNSGLAGIHLVSAAASMKYMDSKQPIVLSSLSRVGSCPGTALQGSLTVCFASSFATGSPCGKDDVSVQGSLDGATVDLSYSNNGYLVLGAPVQVAHVGLGTDGVVYTHDLGGTAGRLVFPTTPAGAHAGEVLCAESVTTKEIATDVFELTLTSISSAGALPGDPVSGTLEITRCP